MADATTEETTTTESVVEDRFTKWFGVFVCNLIALVSFLTQDVTVSGGPQHIQWAASALSIVFALAALAVLAHVLARTKFAGTKIEGGLVSTNSLWHRSILTLHRMLL